jgi:peptidoglycan/LPS O-acetylase OafA/YrhL
LRGLAVALVVAYHATTLSNSPFQLNGGFIGVDVFFVISGFLLTGLLLREHKREGRISFSGFYARRIRRILPAAMATLLVTLVLSYVLVNAVDRPSVMLDGTSAAMSLANFRFLADTNYFTQFSEPQMVHFSPFLQFWSLSVEEQFYLVWPALVALALWRPRFGAAGLMAIVLVASFILSIQSSSTDPSFSFYMLSGRAWQLGAGGLVAVLWGSQDRLPATLRRVCNPLLLAAAGWAALVALILAACFIDFGSTPYSVVSTLVPVVAGVLIIVSGQLTFGPGAFLRLAPVRFLGRISYSLYLWHWPILVLGGLLIVGPFQALSPAQASLLVLVSLGVATASCAFIEEPIRSGRRITLPRPSRVVAAGAAVMLVVALIGVGLTLRSASELRSIGAAGGSDPFSVAGLSPSLADAATDFDLESNCLVTDSLAKPNPACVSAPQGTYTVALVGDSHAQALLPAVKGVAKLHGWPVRAYLGVGCPFLDLRMLDPVTKLEYGACEAWNRSVLDSIAANPPNLIIISMSRMILTVNAADANPDSQSAALVRIIEKLPSSSRVVIIQDPPRPDKSVPQCLATHQTDYRACDYSRQVGFRFDMGARERSAAAETGVGLIDLTDDICPGFGDCPVVIDRMIVWCDESHLTATFSASLAPAIDTQLDAILKLPTQANPSP